MTAEWALGGPPPTKGENFGEYFRGIFQSKAVCNSMIPTLAHWVNGVEVSMQESEVSQTPVFLYDPRDNSPYAKFYPANAALVDNAARAALQAQKLCGLPFTRRVELVEKALHIVCRVRREEFVELYEQELGMPRELAEWHLDYFIPAYVRVDTLNEVKGCELREYSGDLIAVTHKVPHVHKVVASVLPWNGPISMALKHIAHSLLAGSAVILKPSETACKSAVIITKIWNELPQACPGLVQCLLGEGHTGKLVVSHPAVEKVFFVGSIATGRNIIACGAATTTRFDMEMGGNDPAIVCSDVDVKQVAPTLLFQCFLNNGQACVAVKRVYVHDDVFEALVDALSEELQKYEAWPIQNRRQLERLNAILTECMDGGFRLVAGMRPSWTGYCFTPLLVIDPPEESSIVQEEQFGPIVPILRFHDIDDAIARANATCYGLRASVWTNDVRAQLQIARKLQAGGVGINSHLDGPSCGGMKSSGFYTASGEPTGLERYYVFSKFVRLVEPTQEDKARRLKGCEADNEDASNWWIRMLERCLKWIF